jgi:hypothetical protein
MEWLNTGGIGMSHFYGTLNGSRGEATRCGDKNSGMLTNCAGWGGSIQAQAYENDGMDMYRVFLTPWANSGGSSILLAAGRLKSNIDRGDDDMTPWAKELFDSWLPQVENMNTLDWMQRQIANAYTRIGT